MSALVRDDAAPSPSVELPVPLAMLARLLLIVLACKGYFTFVPPRQLPFLPGLDQLGSHVCYALALRSVMLAGCGLALFGGRGLRAGCVLVGGALVIAVLGNRPLFANSRLFAGCVLLLLGLWEPRRGTTLLRWQVALLYAGATLNKVLDPDWWNGWYFEGWLIAKLDHQGYAVIASLLPSMSVSRLLGWLTMAAEATITVSFLRPKWYRVGVVVGVIFHVGALWLTREDFGVFSYAVLLTYLAFVPWPAHVCVRRHGRSLEVILDGIAHHGLDALQRLICVQPRAYGIVILVMMLLPPVARSWLAPLIVAVLLPWPRWLARSSTTG